jgi:hypothetical protein
MFDTGANRVTGVSSQSPAERGEEGVEELGADSLFFVVVGEEDLATKVEAVDQPFDASGVGIAVSTAFST